MERIVAEQGRRGWPMAVLAFEVPEAEVAPTDDPYGVGLTLTQKAHGLPPRLLERVQAIEPQGRRIASTFQEWERDHALCWLDPARLDRDETLAVNAAMQQRGIVLPGNVEAVQRALTTPQGIRPAPVAFLGFTVVLGLAAAFLIFSGRASNRPAGAAAIYRQYCAGCHGETGRGDGVQARLTLLKVPSFADAARMATLTDDYLYTVIAKGSAALGGTSAMPGWDHVLTPEEIRALIAYLRTFAIVPRPADPEPAR